MLTLSVSLDVVAKQQKKRAHAIQILSVKDSQIGQEVNSIYVFALFPVSICTTINPSEFCKKRKVSTVQKSGLPLPLQTAPEWTLIQKHVRMHYVKIWLFGRLIWRDINLSDLVVSGLLLGTSNNMEQLILRDVNQWLPLCTKKRMLFCDTLTYILIIFPTFKSCAFFMVKKVQL